MAAHSENLEVESSEVVAEGSSARSDEESGVSSDVPEWIRRANGIWGRQKRRVWCGHDWHGNVDGYAQSLLGRIREEREGAGQGTPAQRWPEVYWGDGLDVQRSLFGMPEIPYAVLHMHYVWDPEWNVSITQKARALTIAREAYYNALDRAEYWVWSRLDAQPEVRNTQIVEEIGILIRKALQIGETEAINSQTSERYPRELNLAALNRPRISLKAR